MKKLIACLVLTSCLNGFAQMQPTLVPQPAELSMGTGVFNINQQTVIRVQQSSIAKTAVLLQEYFKSSHNILLQTVQQNKAKGLNNYIELKVESNPAKNQEGYSLIADGQKVIITGNSEAGLFYGVQTFFQLLPTAA